MRKLLMIFGLMAGFILVCFVPVAADDAIVQDLIDEASDGDVVELDNRMYSGNITIDKPITLKGKQETVIKGTGSGHVITITADGAEVKNLTIKNSGDTLDHDDSVIYIESDGNRILNNTIVDGLHGIYLKKSDDNEIKENAITGNTDLNPSRRGDGIHLHNSYENSLLQNTIESSRDGIFIDFSEQNSIEKNRITETRYGLHYMYSDHNQFFKNQFFANTGGAAIMYSDHITLKDNYFIEHHNIQSFGILLLASHKSTLESNRILFNQKGMFIDQSSDNHFINNQIVSNRIGLEVWGSSRDNTFSRNTVTNNNLAYSTNSANDQNDWSADGVGNEWGDHVMIDLDQDDIADEPYTFRSSFGEVLADQQLGALFLDAPALTIYEKWHALFDDDNKGVEDPYPIKHKQETPIVIVFILPLIIILPWALIKFKKKTKKKEGDSFAYDN